MIGLGKGQSPSQVGEETSQTQLRYWLSRLTVGRKIALGYTIALGVAAFGAIAGIVVGDRYQRQAWEAQDHVQHEVNLLYRLQANVLQTRASQQQLIPLVKQPVLFKQEYSHLLYNAERMTLTWKALRSFSATEHHVSADQAQNTSQFLEAYSEVPDLYVEQLKALVDQIQSTELRSPQQIETAQKLLLGFTNSPLARKFDQVSDELSGLVEGSYEEAQEADENEAFANDVRLKIIVVSMALSGLIATVLAAMTSRAIARPVEELDSFAKDVTKDSDFDRQAPITTRDEVGALAISLNQLTQRVKQLLTEQRVATEQQLLASEKMSSLGQMLAGVAHEINNPVNFIYGNLNHANTYVADLFDLIHAYKAELPNPSQKLQNKEADIDLEFLAEDLPKLLQSMTVGADRTRQIVLSLRNFSRLDESQPRQLNLHDCIDSTLLILNNRIKKGVTIERNYGALPAIEGYAGSLYQVFMNLLSNALDAVDEARDTRHKPGKEGERERGEDAGKLSQSSVLSPQSSVLATPLSTPHCPLPTITIHTEAVEDCVQIRIADNGVGVAAEHLEKIFDTFFTTKPMGVGTGLGLAISRQIVEEKHHGRLTCTSQVGVGTEFTIVLPIKQPQGVTKAEPVAV